MTSEVNARERRTLVVVLAFRIGFLVDWFVWLAVVSVYFAVFAKLSGLSLFRSFLRSFSGDAWLCPRERDIAGGHGVVGGTKVVLFLFAF